MAKWAYIKYKNGADRDANRGVVYSVVDNESDKPTAEGQGVEHHLRDEWETTSAGGYWIECSDSTAKGDAYDGNGNWIVMADYVAGRANGTITW